MDLPGPQNPPLPGANGHLYAPHVVPKPAGEAMRDMTFTITIKSFGRGDRQHVTQVAEFLWTQLHRAFGADRVTMYSNDLVRRIFYKADSNEEILP